MGRKRIYGTDAEKAAAYRHRKNKELAELRAKATKPVLSDTPEEKIVEVSSPLTKAKSSKITGETRFKQNSPPDRERVLEERFTGFSDGEQLAKRFRTNVKRAKTIVQEIEGLLSSTFENRKLMAADMSLLAQSAEILQRYIEALDATQLSAAKATNKRRNNNNTIRAAKVAKAVQKLFGDTPDEAEIIFLAKEFIAYSTEFKQWAKRHHDVDKALLDIDEHTTVEIKRAIINSDVTLLAATLAEAYLQTPTNGRLEIDNNVRWWHGGWDDFIEWRSK